MGSDGSLYGTTNAGGAANGDGVVFRLSPVNGRKRWIYAVLYNFCAVRSSCADGSGPSGGLTYAGARDGLPYDGKSPLYGFTYRGGRHFGGVAYSLRSRRHWSEHVLYGFCAQGGTDCADGHAPYLTPLLDAGGNLYGVTQLPSYVVKLSPGAAPKWNEAVLYKFCSVSNCADGDGPSSIAMDTSGNLFGTTGAGGSSSQCGTGQGCGVAFEVAPNGMETVLHDFCLDQTCDDGRYPDGIALDQSGNIYGVTQSGGGSGRGTAFGIEGGSFATIYNFCEAGAAMAHSRAG